MNRVPRLWRSGMLGFPLIPSPAGLGSRLASGPYGACLVRPRTHRPSIIRIRCSNRRELVMPSAYPYSHTFSIIDG
jgi:hypothetical protein